MGKSERRCRPPAAAGLALLYFKKKVALESRVHVGNRDGWGPDGDSRKSGSPLFLLWWLMSSHLQLPVHCPAGRQQVRPQGTRLPWRCYHTGLRESGDKRLGTNVFLCPDLSEHNLPGQLFTGELLHETSDGHHKPLSKSELWMCPYPSLSLHHLSGNAILLLALDRHLGVILDPLVP